MKTFLLAFAIFALAIVGMAIGVILRRKSIQGSCGGLANLRDERGNTMCEACTNPSPECAGEPLEKSEDHAEEEVEEAPVR